MVPRQALAWAGAVFLCMLVFYFESLVMTANLACVRKLKFRLNWCSIIFSNCGLGIVLLDVGKLFHCNPVEWVGTSLAIALASLWLVVSAFHVEAIWKGRCLVVD
jgi:tellurite resistance protein TehA-like permease